MPINLLTKKTNSRLKKPNEMELIKINPDHYIIVDDLEIKIGDLVYVYCSEIEAEEIHQVAGYYNEQFIFADGSQIHLHYCHKITHSTKPLEDVTVLVRPDGSDVSETIFDKVKEISLSKVKKIIGEVDMEELELKYHKKLMERREIAKNFRGQVAGNHPDMFTSREMLSMMEGFTDGYTQALEDTKNKKTHWEVEFIDGELKLI